MASGTTRMTFWVLGVWALVCCSHSMAFQSGGFTGLQTQRNSFGRTESPLSLRRPQWRPSGRSMERAVGLRMMDPSLVNFGLGAISGTVANLAVFPADLAKTKMQNAKGEEKDVYSSTLKTLVEVSKQDGVKGLWRGSEAVMLGSAPEAAMQLGMHDWLIGVMAAMLQISSGEAGLPLHWQIMAGCIAGGSTILATNPMEVLRIKAATGGSSNLVDNIKELGPRGLFNGYQATWFRDIPFSGIYFPLFCNTKVWAFNHLPADLAGHDMMASLIAGFAAGMAASLLTTPMDVIKTRIQSNTPAPQPVVCEQPSIGVQVAYYGRDKPSCLQQTILQVLSREGFGALWKGVDARVGRLAPCMAITLVLYEGMKGLCTPMLQAAVLASDVAPATPLSQVAEASVAISEIAQHASSVL